MDPSRELNFSKGLAAPARRALANQGIHSLLQLTKYSEEELLELHGIGKNAIRVLRAALKDIGKDLKLSS
ncbi:DNA-directed RNA polymerase subunit alpha C-terminal domain-containing protein [Leptospira licerasiae]|uniref:Bacterial RNA polymerase, alpha chain C-terminal domain protein n=1 Tax=Leptospira licerasiae str. MMD4847 TaxID=1049971 RepID=A0ABP2RAR4_9LEPT|nr:DNA-directed RNA polymerase subunit alpha C-terminal domain-containing protein [Leptospira licerasiae]EJZ41652.1 bacterial RNA polymerase, alpha chain C-terminal domain protein [Leptospira licerasiae str. MMD4847]